MKASNNLTIVFAAFLTIMFAQINAVWGQEHNTILKITSADMVSKAWDSQFFIVLDKEHPILSGDEGELSMDVRAIKGTTLSTQMYKAPQEFLYSNGMNNISFTTEWVHIKTSSVFSEKQEGGYTICFNLNEFKDANCYFFDNISFKINGEELIQNGDFEGDIFSNFFYVYDRGDVKQVTSDMIIEESDKPISIEVTTLPDVNYFVGDNLRLSNGVLSLISRDYAPQQIPLTAAEVTGYNPNLVGEQTLTVSYLDLITSFNVIVQEKDPNAINHVLRISSNGLGEQKELRIKLSQALPVGTEYSFSMNYYADKTVDRLSEYSVNGFCVFIGIADFTTQKKTYTKTDVVKNPDSKSIVFPLNCTVENNYYFDNISLIVNGKEMLYNGSFENTNLSNYYQNEANNVTSDMVIEEGGNPIAIEITSLPQTEYMVGKSLNLKNGILTLTYPNGSTKTKPLTDVKVTGYNAKKLGVQTLTVSYLNLKTTFDVVVKEKDFIIDHCLKITSADMVSKAWDSQFFIVLDKEHPIQSGDEGELSMDVRAIKGATISTQMHKAPQEYLYYNGMNEISFTTEWVHINTLNYFIDKQEGGYTISFNLNDLKEANSYLFDNISFKINGEEQIQNGDFEGDNFSNFFYVYDRGDVKQVTSDMIIDESSKPVSIAVTTLPETNYYVGDNLFLSKGILSLKFSDDATQQIPLTTAEVTGYNPNLIGEQTLTVSYLDLKTSFKVMVKEKDPNAINHVLRISSNGFGEQKELRIKLSQALPVGTEYSFSMNYYADKEADRLSEYSANGSCVFIGIVDFTTQKNTYTKTDVVKYSNRESIVFPLNCTEENNYYFDNISLIVNGKEMLYNGSFESTNLSNYYQDATNKVTSDMVIEEGGNPIAIEVSSLPKTEYIIGEELDLSKGVLSLIYADGSTKSKSLTDIKISGYNPNSLGEQTLTTSYTNLTTTFKITVKEKDPNAINHFLIISSADMEDAAWDSQFYIILDKNNPILEGDQWECSMDIRAIKTATIGTQTHKAPRELLYWDGIGNIDFSTEWKTVRMAGVFSSKYQGGYSICFNLNDYSKANKYYFDNISFKINGKEVVKNGDFEGDDLSSFIYRYKKGDSQRITEEMVVDKNGNPIVIQPKPYAVFSNGVLTFYYDKNCSSDAYEMRNAYQNSGWASIASKIKKIVFDKSFKDFTPTNCAYWFCNCINLTKIEELNNLNTEMVSNMEYMFAACCNLSYLDINGFNTERVINMRNMFSGCNKVTYLDLEHFCTKQVKNMERMFYCCNNLKTIYIGDNWSTAALTNSNSMFSNCIALVGGAGTKYDEHTSDATYACIDGGAFKRGYFSTKKAIVITISDNKTIATIYDNGMPIQISTDIEVDAINLTRLFISNTTSTIVLPFDIATGKYSGGDFYTFSNMKWENDKWVAEMTKVTSVEAHKPYLFEPTADNLTIIGGVTLKTGAAGFTEQGYWKFTGLYERKDWSSASNKDFGFSGKAVADKGINVGEFVRIGKGVWANPMRCYLTYSGDNPALSKSLSELPTRIEVRLIDETATVIDPDVEPIVEPVDNPDDIETTVSEIVPNSGTRVWVHNKTIFIESTPNTEYQIIDINGKTLKKGITHSDREEVALSRNADGIVIVRIANKSYKIKY